jgi:hypothetical protein
MDIFRQGINKLSAWKNKPNRKPLVLQGARQVGKTWLMNQFGKEQFESVAYFNFEEQPELKPWCLLLIHMMDIFYLFHWDNNHNGYILHSLP